MKNIAFVLILMLAGCAPSRTRILWHDGREIIIDSQDKASVTMKIDGDEVTVDSRSSSVVQDMVKLMQMMLVGEMRQPIVNK